MVQVIIMSSLSFFLCNIFIASQHTVFSQFGFFINLDFFFFFFFFFFLGFANGTRCNQVGNGLRCEDKRGKI